MLNYRHILITMLKLVILVLALASAQIGAKPNKPRIIGGSPAEQGQFPFLASLQYIQNGFHFCGASIIDDAHLITAGHCLYQQYASEVAAYVGSVYLSGGGVYYYAARLTVHPNFDPNALVNDVALVTLQNRIQFGGDIQPINLPVDIFVNVGDSATATGWGDISYPNEQTPNQLQQLTRRIVDSQQCASALGTNINNGQICFGGDGGHGLCYGDSGSPLVYNANGYYYVIGVVSWGEPCGVGYPDVYTRITYYLPWIQQQLKL